MVRWAMIYRRTRLFGFVGGCAIAWGSLLGCDGAPAETGSGGGGVGGGQAGGPEGGSGGTGGEGGGAFVMAPHPPFPVIKGSLSKVIPEPKLVTITFEGYAHKAEVEAAGDKIGTSDWLAAVGADYGVTTGTHIAKLVLPGPVPTDLSDPDLMAQIDAEITAGNVPAPADDVLYMIYISPGTTFDDGFGYVLCDEYLGYHYQYDATNGTMTYAIVGDCNAPIAETTATFAHEYIEAASDPGFVGGFFMQLSPSDPWYCLDGYENADICDYADYLTEDGVTYQRVWSNSAAAAAVTSPCAPIDPTDVFYNVFSTEPAIPEVAVGQSFTFTITGWSVGPVPDWTLSVDPVFYGEFEPTVEFSSTTINNGESVTLTLTVPPGTPKGSLGTAMVYSGDGYNRFWPVSVWSK